MLKRYIVLLQYILPHHLISKCIGKFADSRWYWIKNLFIRRFMRNYQVDLLEAEYPSPDDYPTFNAFFIRRLKPECRPIDADPYSLVSPVDGSVAAVGQLSHRTLLQAKNLYFDLSCLVAGDSSSISAFEHGQFATLYLAPYNYHRVHMPIEGKLIKSIYVPGRLFSVNRMTTDLIPNLYGRNERLITIFDTSHGQIAIILVGALIVGSIQTSWMSEPIRSSQIITQYPETSIELKKGQEMGYFKLGSTVILLCGQEQLTWLPSFNSGQCVYMGRSIANLLNN